MAALPLVTPIINAASGLWGTIFGSRRERDSQYHRQSMAAHDEFAAEFTAYREGRTWWDSLIDGINRLPRPVMVFLVIAYFITSWRDPELFAKINVGLASVPEPMWILLGTVAGFFFGARELSLHRKSRDFQQAAKAAGYLKAAKMGANKAGDASTLKVDRRESSSVPDDPMARFDY